MIPRLGTVTGIQDRTVLTSPVVVLSMDTLILFRF